MVGTPGGMSLNIKTTRYDPAYLVEYGVHTEQTTHRLHVDTAAGKVIVFRTRDGVRAMPDPVRVASKHHWELGNYYLVAFGSPASPNGTRYATARGCRISAAHIHEARDVTIPTQLLRERTAQTTSGKGVIAVRIVSVMLRHGLIPLAFDVKEVNEYAAQIRGVDLSLETMLLQVKYDDGCSTRGLFMQTHEWNPNKWH